MEKQNNVLVWIIGAIITISAASLIIAAGAGLVMKVSECISGPC